VPDKPIKEHAGRRIGSRALKRLLLLSDDASKDIVKPC